MGRSTDMFTHMVWSMGTKIAVEWIRPYVGAASPPVDPLAPFHDHRAPIAGIHRSPLHSPDLAPIPSEAHTWSKWNLAAMWVGMAVCIPAYILASYMVCWQAALTIHSLKNLEIILPMMLNGHAGVKYGIPIPVM